MANQTASQKEPTLHHLSTGMRVDVRRSFEGTWSPGFEIAEIVVEHEDNVGYRLRRQSDGSVLAAVFPAHDVIPAGR